MENLNSLRLINKPFQLLTIFIDFLLISAFKNRGAFSTKISKMNHRLFQIKQVSITLSPD